MSSDGTGSSLDADTVDGLHANEIGNHYQNVVVVSKSGGDYTSVQAAIDSITSAAADNPYLVWVTPGVYSETVTMKPFVHLQGAGEETTVITSTLSDTSWPAASKATLLLASDTSLRDLTVGNRGAGDYNIALMAKTGVTRTLVADVTVWARGAVKGTYAIVIINSGTGVTLKHVNALSENGSLYNIALRNGFGAAATLHGGSFTGRGGTHTGGIYNEYTSTLKTEGVTALGENGSNQNIGLANYGSSSATLRGGSLIGRGGTHSYGIRNYNSGTMMDAVGITALGENGSIYNWGLYNNISSATLRDSTFTGRGGTDAHGIYTTGTGMILEAESITALGENSSINNYGLYNELAAVATLHSSSFTAGGGTNNYGLRNYLANVIANSTQFIGSSYGLFLESGTGQLGVCQLDGGATNTSGTLTCFQVYDGSYASYSCP